MIGAVVVLYNPSKEEIQNINTYKNKVAHTVIIDNSDENNRALIDNIVSINSNITYYSEQNNLGLAKAFNLGIDILYQKGCQWVLLFDADSKIGSDIFTIYKNTIQKYNNNKVALFAPVHIHERSKNKPYNGYKEIKWSMTSGCLYNCEIFIKQEGFFEKLFVDGLDMDYCLKSHENHYLIIECGNAIINHSPAKTKKILGIKYGIDAPFRYFMQARQLIWCWKRYNNLSMLLIYIYKWGKVIFLFPNKKEYIKSMIKGTKEGYTLINDWNDKK